MFGKGGCEPPQPKFRRNIKTLREPCGRRKQLHIAASQHHGSKQARKSAQCCADAATTPRATEVGVADEAAERAVSHHGECVVFVDQIAIDVPDGSTAAHDEAAGTTTTELPRFSPDRLGLVTSAAPIA